VTRDLRSYTLFLSVLISDVIFSLWMSSVCHFGHESENFGRARRVAVAAAPTRRAKARDVE
jgi:hypothetical protein